MTAPTIYRSDDPNAPVLNGSDRTCVVNLLKSCLVDGYGSKPGAGWTMPFVSADGSIAAFRNNPANGTGFFIKFDGNSSTYSNSISFSACEAMTSIDDSLFVFGNGSKITFSNTRDTVARPWIIIATDTYFYLISWSYYDRILTIEEMNTLSYTGGLSLFFGDIEKLYINDSYNCCLSFGFDGMTSGAPGFGIINDLSNTPSNSSSKSFIARGIDGIAGGKAFGLSLSPPGAAKSGQSIGAFGMPYDITTGLFVSKTMLHDSSAYGARGYLPGLLVPCHCRPFGQLEEIEIDGGTYVAITWRNAQSTSLDSVAQAFFGPIGVAQ